MPQFLRPIGEKGVNGGWSGSWSDLVGNGGGPTAASTPNDTTILQSPSNPAAGVFYDVYMSQVPVSPPGAGNVVVRYRFGKDANAGRSIDFTAALYDGSTLIASWSHTNIGNVLTTAAQTLTTQQRANITNWNDLDIRFDPAASGGGAARSLRATWAEIEVPDGSAPAKVTGLASTEQTASSISLTWNSVAHATYHLERNGSVVATGIPTAGVVDENLTTGTEYTYRVRAFNGMNGVWSDPLAVSTSLERRRRFRLAEGVWVPTKQQAGVVRKIKLGDQWVDL
jgi:hypothetical protein